MSRRHLATRVLATRSLAARSFAVRACVAGLIPFLLPASASALPITDHDLDFSIDVDGPNAALCVAYPPELQDEILCIAINPDAFVPDTKPGVRPGPVVLLRMTDWTMGMTTTFSDATDAGRVNSEDGERLSNGLRDVLGRHGRKVRLHGETGALFDMITIAGRPAIRTIAECQDSIPALPSGRPFAPAPSSAASPSTPTSPALPLSPMFVPTPMIPAPSAEPPPDREPACESKIVYWTSAAGTLVTFSFSVPRDRLIEARAIIEAILVTAKMAQPLAREPLVPTMADNARTLARRYAAPMTVIIAVVGFFYAMIRRGTRNPGRDAES